MIFHGMAPMFQEYAQWWICGVIAVLGIVVYGFRDLIRLSIGRVWAISGVCFAESVRRKIWLITPLAIVGVIVVGQLQRPLDERDAIRATIKFCLFATGLLVTITAIILACTNLPREIDNRVIFTIVTKPTTRLEIVLGKVLGFARVSALILVIMGVFTLAYLQFRARPLVADLRARLDPNGNDAFPPNSPGRSGAGYCVNAGLLGTRSLDWAVDPVQVYARPPEGDEHWMMGGESQYVLLGFALTPEQREQMNMIAKAGFEMDLHVSFDIDQTRPPD